MRCSRNKREKSQHALDSTSLWFVQRFRQRREEVRCVWILWSGARAFRGPRPFTLLYSSFLLTSPHDLHLPLEMGHSLSNGFQSDASYAACSAVRHTCDPAIFRAQELRGQQAEAELSQPCIKVKTVHRRGRLLCVSSRRSAPTLLSEWG